MKNRAFFLLLNFLISICGNVSSYTVGAYYQSWAIYREEPFYPKMINPFLIDELYFAFAIFDENFEIQSLYPDKQLMLAQQCQDLKKRSHNALRLYLSIGGDTFNNPEHSLGKNTSKLFSQMVATPENRRRFITSAITYSHRYGFDGVDIDWEFPGDLKRGGSEDDFSNFITFLKECSSAFHSASPPLKLSYAAPASVPAGLPQRYRDDPKSYFVWLAECAKYLDRIVVMAYNYHTPYDPLTGVNAPLLRDTDAKSTLYIAKTLDNYLQNGVPAEKMLLGLPLYGWGYEGVSAMEPNGNGAGKSFTKPAVFPVESQEPGFLGYSEIISLLKQKKLVEGFDPITTTAFAFNSAFHQWVSFDTPATISAKVKEAEKHSLAGVVFWAIDLDLFPYFPMIRAAKN